MKYLKTKNISKFSINDRTLIAYPSGVGPGNRIVMNATGGLMLPKGTGDSSYSPGTPQNQRPQLSGVRQPVDANGTIRYNTSLQVIEAYVGGTWVIVASPVASAIVKQTFGPGDGVDRIFGRLSPAYEYSYSASADNVIVLIENVFQISSNNYIIVQNPSSANGNPESGSEIAATSLTSAQNGTQYVITTVGTTNFTALGASANTVGTVFTKSGGTGTGSGEVREAGYYLKFTSAVPDTGSGGNPVYVTVYHGYAN